MIEKTIEVERMEHVISVFGSFDQNLRIIESELGVKVLDRENMIHICGEAEDVMLAEKAINGLLLLAAKGENIDAQNVRYILKLVSEGKETKINELAAVGFLSGSRFLGGSFFSRSRFGFGRGCFLRLDLCGCFGLAAGAQCEHHNECKQKSSDLLHVVSSIYFSRI